MFAGTQVVCVPADRPFRLFGHGHCMLPQQQARPVRRDAIDVRRRQLRRACCQESIPCAAPKIPMGLSTGTHSMCGAAKSAGPVVSETYHVRCQKVRRACSRRSLRCEAPVFLARLFCFGSFGDFRCGGLLFIVILVIYKYKYRLK